MTATDKTINDGTPAGRPERTRLERYDATEIEPRWQARWDELGLHETDLHDESRPKSYILTMYPYPSGDLHIGHWYIVTPTDALARFHRMHGENVFFPIGFDAFGLPAENAAIKNNINPRDWTMQNIEHERKQFRSMGAVFDWRFELVTCEPEFYRWNQWLFLRFLEAGLAYRRKSPVDWCPNDGTLAREQVEGVDRHCWRCGAPVEKRDLEQWYLRTTKYADELLDFSGIDWPEPIQLQQTNWIGRSEGAEIVFTTAPDDHQPGGDELRVFTTRPDTLFGATFMVLAPEHPLVAKLTAPSPADRGRGLCRQGPVGHRDRAAVDRSREDRRLSRRGRDQPGQRRAGPDLDRRLRAGRLRHRRDHGRARPRRARLRVRDAVRAADPAGHRAGRDARRRAARRRLRRPHAGRAARRRPVGSAGMPAPRGDARHRRTGWPRTAGRRPRSRTGCATGYSAASATGGRRSRSSTASATGSCRSRTRTCRSGCPTRSTTAAEARTR